MKKIIIIISLAVVFQSACFSKSIFNVSYSPQNNDVGLIAICNHLYFSIEYANYKLIETKILRTSFGYSFNIDNRVKFNNALSVNVFNSSDIKTYTENGITTNVIPFKPITIESGFTCKAKNNHVYITIMTDLVYMAVFHSGYENPHFKFGLGYKF